MTSLVLSSFLCWKEMLDQAGSARLKIEVKTDAREAYTQWIRPAQGNCMMLDKRSGYAAAFPTAAIQESAKLQVG